MGRNEHTRLASTRKPDAGRSFFHFFRMLCLQESPLPLPRDPFPPLHCIRCRFSKPAPTPGSCRQKLPQLPRPTKNSRRDGPINLHQGLLPSLPSSVPCCIVAESIHLSSDGPSSSPSPATFCFPSPSSLGDTHTLAAFADLSIYLRISASIHAYAHLSTPSAHIGRKRIFFLLPLPVRIVFFLDLDGEELRGNCLIEQAP